MATPAALAVVMDVRDLDPTEPDANGDRWVRREDGGRRIWWCGCGVSSGWIPRADLLDSLREHTGCPVADGWPDKTKERIMSETDLPKNYTVTGPFIVAGVHPGDTVTTKQLAAHRADVGQLIAAGHIAEVATETKAVAKKADG